LSKLGLRTESRQVRIDGKPARLYRLDPRSVLWCRAVLVQRGQLSQMGRFLYIADGPSVTRLDRVLVADALLEAWNCADAMAQKIESMPPAPGLKAVLRAKLTNALAA